MVRFNTRIREALRRIGTSEVEISYHCAACKGYYTGNMQTEGIGSATCRCGSRDLLLLSVAAEPSSPLLRGPLLQGRG